MPPMPEEVLEEVLRLLLLNFEASTPPAGPLFFELQL